MYGYAFYWYINHLRVDNTGTRANYGTVEPVYSVWCTSWTSSQDNSTTWCSISNELTTDVTNTTFAMAWESYTSTCFCAGKLQPDEREKRAQARQQAPAPLLHCWLETLPARRHRIRDERAPNRWGRQLKYGTANGLRPVPMLC